jgi:hypothetical protein
MLRDSRIIAELAYSSANSNGPIPVGQGISTSQTMPNMPSVANEEPKKEVSKQAVKDWIRLEPGLYPIDTVRKADHTAHTILQFIYSICASPDAVHRVLKTINKAYKQDHK